MHHVEDLHPEDETRRDRIPITSVPRTLLDLAAVADTPKLLTRAVNEADRQGRLNRRAVRELIDRNSGNRGVRRLRTVIAAVSPGTGRSRSDLETLFLAVCRKYGLPQPNVNTMIEGFEVDIHFPGTRLIVELDSWKYHGTPHSFDRDRRRDAELKRRGYEVLRVSDKWLNADPRGVAETVRALIERPVQRT